MCTCQFLNVACLYFYRTFCFLYKCLNKGYSRGCGRNQMGYHQQDYIPFFSPTTGIILIAKDPIAIRIKIACTDTLNEIFLK